MPSKFGCPADSLTWRIKGIHDVDGGVLPVVNDVCAQDSRPVLCSSRTGPKECRPDFSQWVLLCKKESLSLAPASCLELKEGNLRAANSFSNKLLFFSFDFIIISQANVLLKCKIHHSSIPCKQVSASKSWLFCFLERRWRVPMNWCCRFCLKRQC